MRSGHRVSLRRARRVTGGTARPVVVVGLDQDVLAILEATCRKASVPLDIVDYIAELERWPGGHIVVTDAAHATPFWRTVGVADVIVFAPSRKAATPQLDGAARRVRSATELAAVVLAWSSAARKIARQPVRFGRDSRGSRRDSGEDDHAVLPRMARGEFFAGCVESALDPIAGPSAIATAQRDWCLGARQGATRRR